MSILRHKAGEFPERFVITGLVLLFAALLSRDHQLGAHPLLFAVSVLLLSLITIGVYRAHRAYWLRTSFLLRDPELGFYNARIGWQIRRRIRAIHRDAENREERIVAGVVGHLTALDMMLWHQFPHLKIPLRDATNSIAVALLEDDSRQLGSVVVMNVLSRLGFRVSAVEQELSLVSSSRAHDAVFHFSQGPADIVLVGKKVYPELVNRYLAEVYPWRDKLKILFGNDAAFADKAVQVFLEQLSNISPPPPPYFLRLVSQQIIIAMNFWVAHSDQRHHLFLTPDLPHERDPWPH